MPNLNAQLAERCHKLGLPGESIPTDRLGSTLTALACFPMYMVANVHAWTPARQWQLPVLDLPGWERIREAFVIGEEESSLEMTKEDRRVLSSLLSNAKPPDLVIYEYAVETLKQALTEVAPPVADRVRSAVAHMIMAVARASGEGLFGSGAKVSSEEKACIDWIAGELELHKSQTAAARLGHMLA